MPRSKASQYARTNIFNFSSLDSVKDLYRTSYVDDFGKKQAKTSSVSSGSVKYSVIPPIGNTRQRNGRETFGGVSSKSESSLPDLLFNRSLSESRKYIKAV